MVYILHRSSQMPEDLQGSHCSEMRALIITEHLPPASLRLSASPRSLLIKSSSSNKIKWGFLPGHAFLFKHLQRCILLLFGLFLCLSFIFALCTVEESMKIASKRSPQERRLLGVYDHTPRQQAEPRSLMPSSHTHVKDMSANVTSPHLHTEPALHGLGALYMKGTKPMQNLIIANLEDACDILDFRLFMRTLFRSGTMLRADLVLLFPWPSLPPGFSDVLKEEEDSFNKLLAMKLDRPAHSNSGNNFGAISDILRETKRDDNVSLERGRGQIIWGANPTSSNSQDETNFDDPDCGSVVGFHINELDSTDAYSEFLTNPSSQLRRWLCYQMLLGLLRYKFNLVMLVDLGGVAILGDVFAKPKRKEFLHLTVEDSTWADEAIAESHHIPLRQSSSLGGLLQGTFGRVMENDNLLDDIDSRATTRRRKMHGDHMRRSRVKGRKRDLLGGGVDAEVLQVHDKDKDASAGETRAIMDSTQDRMKYARAKQGLMEMVYGREVWNSLEQVEKQRRVISSRVILGSMRSAKGLANSMVVETVRVALQRNTKLSFPDRALLSYLLQKSPHLIGRRITENLQVSDSSDSMIHSVESKSKLEDVFGGSQEGRDYLVLHASSLNRGLASSPLQNEQNVSIQSNATLIGLIMANICASTTNASFFYHDCGREEAYT